MSAVLYQLKASIKDAGVSYFSRPSCKSLVNYGFKYIAAGMYGAVFDHPTDPTRVLKTGLSRGDGWVVYATYCLVNKTDDNDHLLKVHSLHLFQDMYVAEIERLTLYDKDSPTDAAREQYDLMREYNSTYPELLRLWTTVAPHNDLHPGNIMMRGDIVVVTDPYCSVQSREDTYNVEFGIGRVDSDTLKKRLEDKALLQELQNAEPKVAYGSPVFAPWWKKEDHTLRLNPINERRGNPERMAGILPQVRGNGVGSPDIAYIVARVVEAIKFSHDICKFANGFQFRIFRQVPYLHKCPPMVLGRRGERDFERDVQARVQRELAPGRDPNSERIGGFDRGMLAEAFRPRFRPEVFNKAIEAMAFPIIGKCADFIILDDLGPAVQPDNNRGRIERHKGRTIPTKCLNSRDVLRRQADADVRPQAAKWQAGWDMARPRQSWFKRNAEAMRQIRDDRAAMAEYNFYQRPKEPYG